MSDWKPGDVALVPGVGRALMLDSGQWVTQSNKHRWSLPGFAGFNNVTPLAVVDPEDMEAVERVRDALWRGGTLEQWQEGLRTLANPKPPKRIWTDGDVVQHKDGHYSAHRLDDGWRTTSQGVSGNWADDMYVTAHVETGALIVLREQAAEAKP